jgi:predicted nuclease with TOPRIM domain
MKRYRFTASDDSGLFTDLQTGEVVDAWELDGWVCCSAAGVADLERRHAETVDELVLAEAEVSKLQTRLEDARADNAKLRAELDEAVKQVAELRGKVDAAATDVRLMLMAVKAGDPKRELILRCEDMHRRLTATTEDTQ